MKKAKFAVTASTLVWLPGMADWQKTADVPVVINRIVVPPARGELTGLRRTNAPFGVLSSGSKPSTYLYVGIVCLLLDIVVAACTGTFVAYDYYRYCKYDGFPHIWVIPYLIYYLSGVAAIVSARKVNKAWSKGDALEAQKCSRNALLCGVIGFIVGVLFLTIGSGMDGMADAALRSRCYY